MELDLINILEGLRREGDEKGAFQSDYIGSKSENMNGK